MTRVKGARLNRKGPFEGTSWHHMKQQCLTDERSTEHNTKCVKSKNKTSQRTKLEIKDTVCNRFDVVSSVQHRENISIDIKSASLAAELECMKLPIIDSRLKDCTVATGSTSRNNKRKELFADIEDNKKDSRREKRRLKRIDEKESATLCYKCRQFGHQVADCPQLEADVEQGTGVCFKCGSTEHQLSHCRAKVAPGQYPFAKCFICNELGHLSNACPDNPRGLYPNGGCCLHCGSVEHYKKDCPDNRSNQFKDEMRVETSGKSLARSVDDEPSLRVTTTPGPAKTPRIIKF